MSRSGLPAQAPVPNTFDLIHMFRLIRIRTRLVLGPGLVMAIAAVLLALASAGLHLTKRDLLSITEQLIPAAEAETELAQLLSKSADAQASLVSSSMIAMAAKGAIGDWRESQAAIDKLIEGYAALPLSPARAERLAALRGDVDVYRKAVNAVIGKIENNSYAQAHQATDDIRNAEQPMQSLRERLAEQGVGLAEGSRLIVDAASERIVRIFALLLAGLAAGAVLVLLATTAMARSIVKPLAEAQHLAHAIADGDLKSGVEPGGRDEAAELMRSLVAMQRSLRGVIGRVGAASVRIAGTSAEMATGNVELSTRTEQTAGGLQQAAGALERITQTMRESSAAAARASGVAASASDVARRGGQVV